MVEKKESKHDVNVRYNDGSTDMFRGVKIVNFKDGVLEIRKGASETLYIVINKVSWWTKEEVKA